MNAVDQEGMASMQLFSLASNPVPSGGIVGTFAADDGVPLRFARFDATRGPRRGTVCILPGRGEFIEKYFEVIAELRRRGFAVATLDWRGQGLSHRALTDKARGHITNFSVYDRDLTRFMRDVVLPDCPPPYVALAHSMGGNIVLRHAVDPGSWFERMVLCAPMIAIAPERLGLPTALAQLIAESSCLAGFSTLYTPGGTGEAIETKAFDGNLLTSDAERYARNRDVLLAAPQLGLGSPTMGWLRAALRTCAHVGALDYPQKIKVPALLFAPSDDQLVSVAAIERFGSGLKVGTHILMPGSRHEILQESEGVRQRFWAAFDAYFGVERVAA
jgi:lysophospholipase